MNYRETTQTPKNPHLHFYLPEVSSFINIEIKMYFIIILVAKPYIEYRVMEKAYKIISRLEKDLTPMLVYEHLLIRFYICLAI